MRNNLVNPMKGLVVSDLHLFARRSRAEAPVKMIRELMAGIDLLVLNGDIFDFRWSVLDHHDATEGLAIDWLAKLLEENSSCQIHYVLGNHDCRSSFVERLRVLASTSTGFFQHELAVQMGASLFLHGDCANRKQDGQSLDRYRKAWRDHAQKGRSAATLYHWADQLGFTSAFHACCFPRAKTVQRVAHYLDLASPTWRQEIKDCYFGHTHLPFCGYEYEGVRFHNTGSAIGNMGFNPIFFSVPYTARQPNGSFVNPVRHGHET